MKLALLAALLLLACGKPARTGALDEEKLKGLETIAKALPYADPADKLALFVQGIAELGLYDERCSRELAGWRAVNPAERARAAMRAYQDCAFTCPPVATLEAIAKLPPADRSRALVDGCNEGGKPDPIPMLGGNLDNSAYLVVRNVVDRLDAAVAADGSPRAKAARDVLISTLAQ